MDAEISEKLLPKKSIKNTVLSTRLRVEKYIINKPKFYQKSLKISQSLELENSSNMGVFSFNVFEISLSLEPEKVSNNSLFHLRNSKKSHAWVSDFWWNFDLFFMVFSALKRTLKTVFSMDFLGNNFSEILASI